MNEDPLALTAVNELEDYLRNIDGVMIAAVKISERAIGIDHTGRQNRALYLFAKLIAHCMSIMKITSAGLPEPQGVGLLDHSSVAALGRVVVDCSIMIMYISEPKLTADEWNLRLTVLHLHELLNRKRFLTALSDGDNSKFPFFENYKIIKK